MASLLHLTSTFMSLWSFSIILGSGATFNLVNRCSYVVWPTIETSGGSPAGSRIPTLNRINPDSNTSVELPSTWIGSVSGRAGCISSNGSYGFFCDDGSCGGVNNSVDQCTKDSPLTLAEFSLGAVGNLSYYDISVVDGFNLALSISPSLKNTSSLTCASPSCIADALSYCPAELLRVSDKGTPLACSTACSVFQTDQYCCRGNYSSCAPNNYTQVFKRLCPTAYITSTDDAAVYTCPVTDFTITFCSDRNLLYIASGPAPALSPDLPSIPPSPAFQPARWSKHSIHPGIIVGVCIGIVAIVGVAFLCLILMWRARWRSEAEPNILGIGPQKFKYKELHSGTKGFNSSTLLGQGGQGQVYKGILRRGGVQQLVAIKKVASEKAGTREMRDYLVQLQGWCKRRGELLVVYDYMPNSNIEWHIRYKIICGLSTALLYLHEEGKKRVVHRDVKPSNIMLDADFEAKLGDFGLARVVDHDVIPRSTTAVGTIGYMAPEIVTTRLPTAESDVFSFGIVALEVACGRPSCPESDSIFLLDKVRDLNQQGRLMEAVDPRLAGGFDLDEMERLLFVGLAATDTDPEKRPTIRQILAILTKQAPAA